MITGRVRLEKAGSEEPAFLNYTLRLTRDIGQDKIDVKDTPDILCRFDKEHEKKMTDRAIAAMYSLRD